jgi:hypothetical protein
MNKYNKEAIERINKPRKDKITGEEVKPINSYFTSDLNRAVDNVESYFTSDSKEITSEQEQEWHKQNIEDGWY